MGMRNLIEDLHVQVDRALGEQDGGDEYADDAAAGVDVADAAEGGDGESLEPEIDPPTAESDVFADWAEGVPVVAAVDTMAYDGEGDAVDVPAQTTGEIVAVSLDADAVGAVIALEDGTEIMVDAEGAADWTLVDVDAEDEEGEEAEAAEDEADDVEDEAEDEAEDEEGEDAWESTDALARELRGILDEGCKKKGKGKGGKGGKGKAKAKPAPGDEGAAMAESAVWSSDVEPGAPADALALAYVYAMLLDDAVSQIEQGAAAGDATYQRLAGAGNFSNWAMKFQVRAKPVLRELGYAPAALQRLAGRVQAKAQALVGSGE